MGLCLFWLLWLFLDLHFFVVELIVNNKDSICEINLWVLKFVMVWLLLQRYFGFSALRPYQKEVIQSILRGKDCLVVTGTGSGKSLW